MTTMMACLAGAVPAKPARIARHFCPPDAAAACAGGSEFVLPSSFCLFSLLDFPAPRCRCRHLHGAMGSSASKHVKLSYSHHGLADGPHDVSSVTPVPLVSSSDGGFGREIVEMFRQARVLIFQETRLQKSHTLLFDTAETGVSGKTKNADLIGELVFGSLPMRVKEVNKIHLLTHSLDFVVFSKVFAVSFEGIPSAADAVAVGGAMHSTRPSLLAAGPFSDASVEGHEERDRRTARLWKVSSMEGLQLLVEEEASQAHAILSTDAAAPVASDLSAGGGPRLSPRAPFAQSPPIAGTGSGFFPPLPPSSSADTRGAAKSAAVAAGGSAGLQLRSQFGLALVLPLSSASSSATSAACKLTASPFHLYALIEYRLGKLMRVVRQIISSHVSRLLERSRSENILSHGSSNVSLSFKSGAFLQPRHVVLDMAVQRFRNSLIAFVSAQHSFHHLWLTLLRSCSGTAAVLQDLFPSRLMPPPSFHASCAAAVFAEFRSSLLRCVEEHWNAKFMNTLLTTVLSLHHSWVDCFPAGVASEEAEVDAGRSAQASEYSVDRRDYDSGPSSGRHTRTADLFLYQQFHLAAFGGAAYLRFLKDVSRGHCHFQHYRPRKQLPERLQQQEPSPQQQHQMRNGAASISAESCLRDGLPVLQLCQVIVVVPDSFFRPTSYMSSSFVLSSPPGITTGLPSSPPLASPTCSFSAAHMLKMHDLWNVLSYITRGSQLTGSFFESDQPEDLSASFYASLSPHAFCPDLVIQFCPESKLSYTEIEEELSSKCSDHLVGFDVYPLESHAVIIRPWPSTAGSSSVSGHSGHSSSGGHHHGSVSVSSSSSSSSDHGRGRAGTVPPANSKADVWVLTVAPALGGSPDAESTETGPRCQKGWSSPLVLRRMLEKARVLTEESFHLSLREILAQGFLYRTCMRGRDPVHGIDDGDDGHFGCPPDSTAAPVSSSSAPMAQLDKTATEMSRRIAGALSLPAFLSLFD